MKVLIGAAWRRRLGGVALAVLLSGCGGGGGGASDEVDDPALEGPAAELLAPYAAPRSGESFGEAQARHLLRRIAFAAPPAEVARCVHDGLAATIDRLVDAPHDEEAEAAAAALIEDPLRPHLEDLQRAWLTLAATTRAPAREKMALLLHQRLAVSGRMLHQGNLRWMQEYRELLRREAFGSWRRLLEDLTRNGAMLVWLSGLPSDRAHPNENYAREFWELFTLGVDVVYTQADVKEAARALTGWDSRWDAEQELEVLYFNAEAHDPDPKTILGQTGNWGETDVVTLTLARPEAARHLARQVFEALAYPSPEAEILDALEALVLDRQYAIAPLVKTILRSRAFFSARARKTQVADPVTYMLGLVRSTQIPFEAHDLLCAAQEMGQVPLDPPSVKGWPLGLAWSGEQPLLRRAAMADALAGKDHVHDREGHDAAPVRVGHLLPPADAEGAIPAAAVVDHLARRLDVSLTAEERAALVTYMDTVRGDGGESEPRPFDGRDAEQVEVKVRGLLSILAQHPDAMRN